MACCKSKKTEEEPSAGYLDTLFYPLHQAKLLARRVQVYGAAFYIYRQYQAFEKEAEGLRGDALDEHWERAHEKLAGVAVWHATSLLGLWVKLAQFMSSRRDVLPDPWVRALATLQDAVPPRAFSEVARTFRRADHSADGSRRRRGCDVDIPWRRGAAPPRLRRG